MMRKSTVLILGGISCTILAFLLFIKIRNQQSKTESVEKENSSDQNIDVTLSVTDCKNNHSAGSTTPENNQLDILETFEPLAHVSSSPRLSSDSWSLESTDSFTSYETASSCSSCSLSTQASDISPEKASTLNCRYTACTPCDTSMSNYPSSTPVAAYTADGEATTLFPAIYTSESLANQLYSPAVSRFHDEREPASRVNKSEQDTCMRNTSLVYFTSDCREVPDSATSVYNTRYAGYHEVNLPNSPRTGILIDYTPSSPQNL